ncbi:hypothetical protein ACN42_g11793 [Penicillium freii]|uniref:Uncharacterized protein n=1 Tax=Penicillium freii TaxID=48697 RepID=A0A124GPN0_PENFR|nr:hypothetical protein ACN42_g11793 [Penicillium freii]
MPTRNPNPQTRWVDSTNPQPNPKPAWVQYRQTKLIKKTAVWPSGLRRLTRNQFRSRAHVRIMQPSCYIFLIFFFAFYCCEKNNLFGNRVATPTKTNWHFQPTTMPPIRSQCSRNSIEQEGRVLLAI